MSDISLFSIIRKIDILYNLFNFPDVIFFIYFSVVTYDDRKFQVSFYDNDLKISVFLVSFQMNISF